ncbi:MAG: DUF1778 domain-containing protein [Rhodospirillaceae bacterium]|nr:DUF1778 domain-containing protein [Rhodospirillaceae bacterium]
MSVPSQLKAERLQVRLDGRAKRLLQRAADYQRESVSQFVLRTALRHAEKVIDANEAVSLGERDWRVFFDALVDPPTPNAALRRAFKRYKTSRA